jgi:hypothetical protein
MNRAAPEYRPAHTLPKSPSELLRRERCCFAAIRNPTEVQPNENAASGRLQWLGPGSAVRRVAQAATQRWHNATRRKVCSPHALFHFVFELTATVDTLVMG